MPRYNINNNLNHPNTSFHRTHNFNIICSNGTTHSADDYIYYISLCGNYFIQIHSFTRTGKFINIYIYGFNTATNSFTQEKEHYDKKKITVINNEYYIKFKNDLNRNIEFVLTNDTYIPQPHLSGYNLMSYGEWIDFNNPDASNQI